MIYSIGFHNPNKIQSLCLKPIIHHRNIIVQSASNSGKTTSLCIGVLQNINAEEKSTQALILVPNRLNASLMRELIVNLGNKMNEFKISVFINDGKIEQQKEKAKKIINLKLNEYMSQIHQKIVLQMMELKHVQVKCNCIKCYY